MNKLVVVRGAGDLASGIIARLHACGLKVLALETSMPGAIRRHVSFSEAIWLGQTSIEGINAVKADSKEEILSQLNNNQVVVAVDPDGRYIQSLQPKVVIDATMLKTNMITQIDMAPIVIGIGPGHQVGIHCCVAIESMRGHNLGRIYYDGTPLADTGAPGVIAGFSRERVCYATASGPLEVVRDITEIVAAGDIIANIGGVPVYATISGLIRGMLRHGTYVEEGLKIADIDPRLEQLDNCFTISDKARTIAGSVLEAIIALSGVSLWQD